MRAIVATAGLALLMLLSPAAATAAPDDPPGSSPFLAPGSPDPGPSTTGRAQQGQTLTGDQGTWGSGVDLTNQWRRCDDTSCVAIDGATGASYTLTANDVGRTIKLRVTGEEGLGYREADSPLTSAVAPPPVAPVATSAPAITGTTREGQRLSATQGTWTGTDPITYSYSWSRCTRTCAATAATGTTYELTAADVGTRIAVTVMATNEAGSASSTYTSNRVRALPGSPVGPSERTVVGRLSPFPVVIITGRLTSRGARITRLMVKRAPRGALVTVRCRGASCPAGRTRRRVKRSSRVRVRPLETQLRTGTVITIYIRKGSRVLGKYTRIRIRRSGAPARVDRCLRPGKRRPVRCPSS